MQFGNNPKKKDEVILVPIPKSKINRPFPLRWGIASVALFAVFAVVTQLQFSRIAHNDLHEARMDTYRSDLVAYDVAVKAHDDCVSMIGVRETYRTLFYGVSAMFQNVAAIPDSAFVSQADADEYQRLIRDNTVALIDDPVKDQLPPRLEKDCPQIPKEKPVAPIK